METKTPRHFQGKKPLQHVIDARIKGRLTMEETHGAELPGHLFAACDAAKEAAVIIVILSILTDVFSLPQMPVFILFLIGYILWKTGRSAILGWSRLERLHRLIEEERFEIEHHRDQEKEELIELYKAKGFSGKLLDDVIDILMADDNRLLQIMLEEEMGLSLETYEHPLKQAFGGFLGVLISSLILIASFWILPVSGPFIAAALIIGAAAFISAKWQRNKIFPAIIWNLGVAALACFCTLFLSEIVKSAL